MAAFVALPAVFGGLRACGLPAEDVASPGLLSGSALGIAILIAPSRADIICATVMLASGVLAGAIFVQDGCTGHVGLVIGPVVGWFVSFLVRHTFLLDYR